MAAKRPSQRALARELGLSPGRITQLAALGMPLYSAEAARAWRSQNVAPVPTSKDRASESLGGQSLSCSPDDETDQPPMGYLQSRARREAAEASMAEMRERELAGDLIRVAAIEAVWSANLAQLREALLQIPNRLGPQLAAESDAGAVINALEHEISSALRNLAGSSSGDQQPHAPA